MAAHPFTASVTGLVVGAQSSVKQAIELPAESMGDEELPEAIAEVSRLKAQVEALQLRLTAEADQRELASRSAATGTDALLAQLTGNTREAMNGGIWLARALQEKYQQTLQALAAGDINLAQAWVIVRAADQIPDWATRDQVIAAEDWLIQKASGAGNRSRRPMNPKSLRRAALRMCTCASTELADAHREAMLNRRKREGERETWLTLHDNGDGTFSGRFVISELHGQLLRAMLEQLSSPRRWVRDSRGHQVEDPTLPGHGGHNWSEGLGLAFCELLENLPSGGWSRNGINMIVTIGLDALRKGLGALKLDTGAEISASEGRRLACNAGIIPAVLDGRSAPLDLGRLKRLHDDNQRRALALLYDSCAAVGCERPFAWCEIHHPEPWAEGGRTDLDNALPLCHFHHRRAHDGMWQLYQDQLGEWRFRQLKWDLSA